RFQERVPRRTADADAFLAQLHAQEQRKRRSRFGTRAQAGAVGRTTVTAERFVERKREAWEQFYRLASQVERSGVSQPASDDFPAAVVQSWGYVLAAFLLFAVPGAIGYAIIRAHPEQAEELLPPVMVSRAEQAAERQAKGLGYAQSREEDLPVIASAIISNNISIAFWAFVGGILAGLPTVLVLVTNGLSLGMGFGLFVNYHAGGYLATFVAGHGVLELTAIFIAGGAGFRVAG